jgi:hypothetical protein
MTGWRLAQPYPLHQTSTLHEIHDERSHDSRQSGEHEVCPMFNCISGYSKKHLTEKAWFREGFHGISCQPLHCITDSAVYCRLMFLHSLFRFSIFSELDLTILLFLSAILFFFLLGYTRVRHGDDDTRHEKTTTYTSNSNLHDSRRQDTKRATFEWATTRV